MVASFSQALQALNRSTMKSLGALVLLPTSQPAPAQPQADIIALGLDGVAQQMIASFLAVLPVPLTTLVLMAQVFPRGRAETQSQLNQRARLRQTAQSLFTLKTTGRAPRG